MASWIQDFRGAARRLRRSPGFTAVAVLTLALGIGANTAIFSLVNGIFLKPLAVERPSELVSISQSLAWQPLQRGFELSYPDYEYYRDHTTSFTDLAAHYPTSPMHLGPVAPQLGEMVPSEAGVGSRQRGDVELLPAARPASGGGPLLRRDG